MHGTPASPTYGRLYVTWDDPDAAGDNEVISYCDTRPGGYPDAAHCDTGANWSTPAVVSDLPAFVEVLGDGALRVPPGDADALAGALLRLAGDADLRARLAAAGAEAVRPLTWERAGRELRAVLATVAADAGRT